MGGGAPAGGGGQGAGGAGPGTGGAAGAGLTNPGVAGAGTGGTAGVSGTGGIIGPGTGGIIGPGTGGTPADAGMPDAACGSATDARNCGACGHDCTALPNVAPDAAGVECRASVCFVPAAACVSGYGHCTSRPDDGCESSLTTTDACGACGMKCASTTSLCSVGAAGATCAATCAAATPDLCVSSCVNLKGDPHNCGACGHDCTTLPSVKPGGAGVTCSAGACVVPPSACVAGTGHCSSRADDGCETSLTAAATCGSCTHACASPTGLCSTASGAAACSSSCTVPAPDLCGAQCVSVASDPANCGACGHDCTTLPNVKPGATGITCQAGLCSIPAGACASGHGHCSSNPNDGCEADLSVPATCGSCALSCAGTTPLCSLQGATPTCLPSCTGTSPDTCGTKCTNKMTDVRNCGTCGHDCTALPGVKPGATAPAVQCVSGACSIQPAGCVSGTGHCTSTPDDGCETDLTRPQTCGNCSNMCVDPTGLCSTAGGTPTCSSSCKVPNPDLCGSSCVDKTSSPTNCGACNHDCTMLANLKTNPPVTCNASGCVVPSTACATGFSNCSTGSNDTDGCETKTSTDVNNCGSCAKVCPTITNGKASCSSGTCSTSCNSGYYSCNGSCVLNSSPCNGTTCTTGYTYCAATTLCLAPGQCCPVPASAMHYLDATLGVDDTNHGGATGNCAYASLAYALGQATGQIVVGSNTFANGLSLTGTQQITCSTAAPYRITTTSTQLFVVSGNNAISNCMLVPGTGVAVGIAAGATFTGTNLNFGDPAVSGTCAAGIYVGGALQLSNSTFNGCSNNIAFLTQNMTPSATLSNNTFNGGTVNCMPATATLNVTGSGDRYLSGATCSATCPGCPF